tara:strand:- start:206 stop:439 length:234 start_codon:yes stop_codon:yes gene_type:complete
MFRVEILYIYVDEKKIIKVRDTGDFMRLTTQLNALKHATSDIWKMHDFNYQLPKDIRQDYWDKECTHHPSSSHCKVY